MRHAVSYGLTGARHRGQTSCAAGMAPLRILLVATTAATITVKPAPTPITRMGISRSHWIEDDVVVAVVVVEFESVCVLVPFVKVVLLVVAVETVVVWSTFMIATVLLCVRGGSVSSVEAVKAKSRSELVLERAILSRIDEHAFSDRRYAMETGIRRFPIQAEILSWFSTMGAPMTHWLIEPTRAPK